MEPSSPGPSPGSEGIDALFGGYSSAIKPSGVLEQPGKAVASTASEAEIQEYDKLCSIIADLVDKDTDDTELQDELVRLVDSEQKERDAKETSERQAVRTLDYVAAKRKGFRITEPAAGQDPTDKSIVEEFESFSNLFQLQETLAPVDGAGSKNAGALQPEQRREAQPDLDSQLMPVKSQKKEVFSTRDASGSMSTFELPPKLVHLGILPQMSRKERLQRYRDKRSRRFERTLQVASKRLAQLHKSQRQETGPAGSESLNDCLSLGPQMNTRQELVTPGHSFAGMGPLSRSGVPEARNRDTAHQVPGGGMHTGKVSVPVLHSSQVLDPMGHGQEFQHQLLHQGPGRAGQYVVVMQPSNEPAAYAQQQQAVSHSIPDQHMEVVAGDQYGRGVDSLGGGMQIGQPVNTLHIEQPPQVAPHSNFRPMGLGRNMVAQTQDLHHYPAAPEPRPVPYDEMQQQLSPYEVQRQSEPRPQVVPQSSVVDPRGMGVDNSLASTRLQLQRSHQVNMPVVGQHLEGRPYYDPAKATVFGNRSMDVAESTGKQGRRMQPFASQTQMIGVEQPLVIQRDGVRIVLQGADVTHGREGQVMGGTQQFLGQQAGIAVHPHVGGQPDPDYLQATSYPMAPYGGMQRRITRASDHGAASSDTRVWYPALFEE